MYLSENEVFEGKKICQPKTTDSPSKIREVPVAIKVWLANNFQKSKNFQTSDEVCKFGQEFQLIMQIKYATDWIIIFWHV